MRLNEASPGALLLSGAVLFHLPLSVVAGNGVYFIFSPAQFAAVLAVAWLAAAVILAAAAGAAPAAVRPACGALLAGAAVLSWLYGWFLTSEQWELLWWRPSREPVGALSADNALALGILACAGLVYVRWRAESVRFLWVLNAGLVLWTLYLIFAASSRSYWLGPPEDLTRFSAERNVIVIILDAFQGDLFGEILEHEPQLAAPFDGFTYYSDAVGIAASTYLSIPTILSGRIYRDGDSIRRFYREAVEEDSFMSHLARAGYVGTYVNPMLEICPRGQAWCGHQATITDGNLAAFARELRLLLEVGLARALPGWLRDILYAGTAIDLDIHDRIAKGPDLLAAVTEGMSVDGRAPRAKFLHLMSTHPPIKLDPDCRPAEGEHWLRDPMRRQATCSVRRVGEFLAALKRHGAYDQSTIILAADHGAGLPPRKPYPGAWNPKFQVVAGMAAVLLVVKPQGARGAMRTSSRFADLRDVSATVCAQTGACAAAPGKPLLEDGAAAAPRARQFLFYPWGYGKWTVDRLVIPERYSINGPSGDPASWRMVAQ